MKYYKEFLITAEPFIPEVISCLLWELNINGVNEEVNCLKIFANEESDLTYEQIKNQLEKLVSQKLLFNFNIEEHLLEDKNWNEKWEKSLNVIEVSDKFVIRPSFRKYEPKPGKIVIEIDPKMSFGTGEHQTTKLILQLLEKYIKRGDKVLDIGAGTGILSIAAIKLGAASAVAVDNYEWCLLSGKENCKLNLVSDKVDVRLGEVEDIIEKDFELILANIQKNILLKIAGEIKTRIKPGGYLILSGLLISDENEIEQKFMEQNFKLIEVKKMDEWIAMVFRFK
ncbi:MAG TPA: 50S ribosomal protein L11 methyltransferase [Ignavibacteria bacterium]|nr:50S ribosomal protein L11 methyltransferase [Ignavibacteria bacterium]